MDPSRLLPIVGEFYDAVDEPGRWKSAMDLALLTFEGKTGALFVEATGSAQAEPEFLSMPGFSETATRLYGSHYVHVDPYAGAARKLPDGGIFLSQDVISPDRFRNSEVWVDFSRTHVGAFHLIGAAVPVGADRSARIAMHRPHDAQPFTATEVALFEQMLHHLSRALKLRRALAEERQLSEARMGALDALISGIIVLDRESRVVVANAAAETLARAGHIALPSRTGGVQLPSVTDTRRFCRLVAETARGGAGGGMLSTRGGEGGKIILTVARLPTTLAQKFGVPLNPDDPLVVVIARDLGMANILDAASLISVFGLTQAEAEVATALAEGQTVERIAEQRGRSVLTVRTQVRGILDKSGATSARHLASLIQRP